MDGRLFCAQTGVRANKELGELCLRTALARQEGAENRGDEAKWNADDAWVGQGEKWRRLDQMPFGRGNVSGVNSHDRGAQDDEENAGG